MAGRNDEPTQAVTQAMIDAYDEYTHLTLDRRGFMSKLTALAGSATAAAAIAPLLGASKAKAAMIAETDPAIDAVWATYDAAGTEMKAYLAKPSKGEGPFPAVIVIHENRGLNAHIQDVARHFATEGFLALAPDFLSSAGGTPPDEDKAREMIGALDAAKTAREAAATVEWLKTAEGSNGRVGAVGFCWGGGLVNTLATVQPDLAAGVAYYGRQAPAEDVPKIKAALMLHYAGLDERINAGIPAFEAALKAAGTDYEVFVYDGVNHAFNNDTSAARYDKAAADLAWGRTTAFLKDKLGGE
ncbi:MULTISPECIES: dienelactone hydrolase family protein [unclassified Aureimonas]|uniref:dienelactone hydrolase family protein n=1 Tax=unclassified Aureimonas TaxID=2615206 RepID=UPI0006FDD32F|nr:MULTISPECIES: dienelactone hydrolase family protein [unclassified Aureimonas]KQT52863.1 carboxymethylenebutenolidase [Aureimonas sp. Leaf427]KQT80322.1 carboxymethylenebutenolidase [Aureimonas sp. Leaf460]